MEMSTTGSRTKLEKLNEFIDDIKTLPGFIEEALPEIKDVCRSIENERFTSCYYADALYRGFQDSRNFNQKVSVFFVKSYLDEVTTDFDIFEGKDQATHLMNSFNIQKTINVKDPKHSFGFWDRSSINRKHKKLLRTVNRKVSRDGFKYVDMMSAMEAAHYPETDEIIFAYVNNIDGMFKHHLETPHGKGSHKPTDYFYNNTIDEYQLANQKIRSATAKRVQEFGWAIGESKIVQACDRVNMSLSSLTSPAL